MSLDHLVLGCELHENFGVSKEALIALGPDCAVRDVIELVVSATNQKDELIFREIARILNTRLNVDAEICWESRLVADLWLGRFD